MFKKAKQNRIFQDIVDQVQQAVVAGELTPGEKLPPEREMCSIFNTSRGTLREALRILEQKKLISIKLGAGGGAIVREPNSELIAENFSLLLQGKQASLTQLSSLAAEMSGLLASLAAAKAGTEDVGPLKQLVAQLTVVMEERQEETNILFQMDTLLLAELGRIADNPTYTFLLHPILEVIGGATARRTADNETQQQHYQEIRMIVYAIAQNDRKNAALLTGKHIRHLAVLLSTS